jgi:ATP-binding cassette, subfamily F, member 3
MTLLSISGVSVEFGATTLFTDITFVVAAGERWGIVGRNGTGKSTLFRLLTGEMQPTRGIIARQPGLKVSMLEQHRDFGDATTVWAAAAGQFAHLIALETSLAEQAEALATHADEAALDRYAHDLERFEREGGYTFAPRVDAVLHGLGFDPVEARTRGLERLSGGERGRVGLARQLVSPSDVILLDEPTNHLDLETTTWLEDYLRQTDKTVLLVSHDRAFLAAVADHILHFEAGTATAYVGGYEAFVETRRSSSSGSSRGSPSSGSSRSSRPSWRRRRTTSAATSPARTRSRPRDGGSGWSGWRG